MKAPPMYIERPITPPTINCIHILDITKVRAKTVRKVNMLRIRIGAKSFICFTKPKSYILPVYQEFIYILMIDTKMFTAQKVTRPKGNAQEMAVSPTTFLTISKRKNKSDLPLTNSIFKFRACTEYHIFEKHIS